MEVSVGSKEGAGSGRRGRQDKRGRKRGKKGGTEDEEGQRQRPGRAGEAGLGGREERDLEETGQQNRMRDRKENLSSGERRVERKRRDAGEREAKQGLGGGSRRGQAGGAPESRAGPRGRRPGPRGFVRALPLPLASFARVMMTNSSVRSRGLRWCCSSYMTKLKWFRDRATRVSLATSAFT